MELRIRGEDMCLKDQENIEYTKTAMKQLVSLVINQDNVTQGWVKFIITIETALIVAFYYLVDLFSKRSVYHLGWIEYALLSILPLLGLVTAIALTSIIVRERKWQAWYARRASKLPTVVFKKIRDKDAKRILRSIPKGYISCWIIGLAWAIGIFWVIVCILGLYKLKCGISNFGLTCPYGMI